jgi:hypothetical protein
MPDRAILPITVAVMGGFFCGLIGSVLELQNPAIVTLAIFGALAALTAGAASVLGVEGRGHASVAILRAFYAALLFLAIDLGLVQFLRDGKFGLALILWIAGGLAAAMLAAPRVTQPTG